ncbi:MAG TPA: VapC toxin family PIN domain ribonuclease [Streptosporangiaceae bacterium]|nr:VapC toxin family PIN domain ribonuclease [Streptosporangiaceae bacterium]
MTDSRSRQITDLLRSEPGPLILSPFVLAELDYLIHTRAGVRDELKVLADVTNGVYSLAELDRFDIAEAAAVVERYRGMKIGLTDASLVILAAKHGTNRILTFDERHFRALRPLTSDAFTLLPADS